LNSFALALVVASVLGFASAHQSNIMPSEALSALQSAKSVVLYSLDPENVSTTGDARFHYYKILGETRLDPAQTRIATRAVEKAVDDSLGYSPDCFNPRHGLRISAQGHLYDFVLCYSCDGLDIYRDGQEIATLTVTGSPQTLNRLLVAAHVPLPRPANR
jgi:hypothetical protein